MNSVYSARILVLLLVPATGGFAADLSLGVAAGTSGQAATLHLSLRSQAAQVCGLQFDLTYDRDSLKISLAAGNGAAAAGKQILYGDIPGGKRVLVSGLNQNVMNDGDVADLTITVAGNTVPGSYPLILTNASATDPFGSPLVVGSNSGSVVVGSHPAFFDGEIAVGNGIEYLQFSGDRPFGYYGYLGGSWIFHADLGYEKYAAADGAGVYLWDLATGHWWYTSPAYFPYLYDFGLNSWLYYFPDSGNAGHYTSNPRWFANLSTGQTISM